MLKRDELSNPESCLNRALDGERIFTLLARDAAAPDTIRDWCERRCRMGLSQESDAQIIGAFRDAELMESERRGIRERLEAAKALVNRPVAYGDMFTDEFLRSKFFVAFSGEGACGWVVGSFQNAIDLVSKECSWTVSTDHDTDVWNPMDLDLWDTDDGNRLFRFSMDVGEMSHVTITRVHEDQTASKPANIADELIAAELAGEAG